MGKYYFYVSLLLVLGLATVAAGSTFSIVERSKATSMIVLGESSTPHERVAASELVKLVKRMSNVELPVGSAEIPSVHNIILIGGMHSSPRIVELISKGTTGPDVNQANSDSFTIKTVTEGGRNYLILAGSNGRGTIYSVYHLFENYLHCGFFEDGDQIPRMQTIELPNIDVREKPHFGIRANIPICALHYTCENWGLNEWKQEIEWTAKKKMNLIAPAYLVVDKAVLFDTYKEFGVVDRSRGLDDDKGQRWDGFLDERVELYKQVVDYARKFGIDLMIGGYNCWVPESFVHAHPEVKYLEMRFGPVLREYFIDPRDPMYVKFGTAYLKNYMKLHPGVRYFRMEPFPESNVETSMEEQIEILKAFAKGQAEIIRAANPDGVWTCSGWAFGFGNVWTPEMVKAFMDAVPSDMPFYVYDCIAEVKPIHKDFDYFYGKDWGFSVLHAFGGTSNLHGDLPGLIRIVRDVVRDPKAGNCRMFALALRSSWRTTSTGTWRQSWPGIRTK